VITVEIFFTKCPNVRELAAYLLDHGIPLETSWSSNSTKQKPTSPGFCFVPSSNPFYFTLKLPTTKKKKKSNPHPNISVLWWIALLCLFSWHMG
jgi:hypothetical protein